MYNAFFGFGASPFNLSPDPAFLYRSPQHEEALANLIYGVHSRKGFVVLTGEVGTGKTTMLECLRDFLTTQQADFAFLFNSQITVEQFFEMIAYDLDLPCPKNSKSDVLFALSQMLIRNAHQGRSSVLMLDEAQNLSWDVLEEVRLLGNLEERQGKLLQVILSGQPELDRKLDAPNLRQLKQRVVLRCELKPLEESETLAYVLTRLEKAGMTENSVLPTDLIREIHIRSQGIPRLINAVCDNTLLTAFALEKRTASLEMLDEVTADMRLDWPGKTNSG